MSQRWAAAEHEHWQRQQRLAGLPVIVERTWHIGPTSPLLAGHILGVALALTGDARSPMVSAALLCGLPKGAMVQATRSSVDPSTLSGASCHGCLVVMDALMLEGLRVEPEQRLLAGNNPIHTAHQHSMWHANIGGWRIKAHASQTAEPP